MADTAFGSSSERVQLALNILAIPRGEMAEAIYQMVRRRKLSATIVALNDLLEQPTHSTLAQDALTSMGLESGG